MRRAALLALVVSGCVPALADVALDQPGGYRVAIEDQGHTRTLELHLPPGARSARALPLVVALHGGGSSGAGLAQATGFDRIADREKIVVVYPDGLGGPHGMGRSWNVGRCCSLAHFLGVDDVAFIEALLDALTARLPIDRSRVYLVGYSNGGSLAQLAAATKSKRFAALGLYGATLPGSGAHRAPQIDLPRADHPLSVILVHALADPRVPYLGSDGDVSFLQGGQFYAVSGRCTERLAPERRHRGTVWARRYRGCDGNAEIDMLSLRGWDHEWPSRERVVACWGEHHPLGRFDAAEAMWRFFADKRRRAR